ncbi:MAG: VTT domain-containing protein [Candidatus Paceibacterota bacterium]
MLKYLDPLFLIQSAGLIGVLFIIFAESGLFFGFFLPGDSLLFTAGFLASQGYFNLFVLIVLTFFAAVLGDNFGYQFGKHIGPKIFTKEDSLFFRKEHVIRTKKFYERYGKKALVIARFIPIVRTFTPILAGVGQMEYKTFFTYNLIGGAAWTLLLINLGFFLGTLIKDADRFILPIVLVIIVISFLPGVWEIIKIKKESQNKKI